MKRIIYVIVVLIPFFSRAQTHGIYFEQGLNWQQIEEKAKMTDKYIFVDCYTARCRACTQMDQQVFSSDSIGAYINSKFISIKVQLDTSQYIKREFSVTTAPAYLFFSPDGKIVDKDMGVEDRRSFMNTAIHSTDTGKQYYTLLEDYRSRNINYGSIRFLAERAKRYGENDLATQLANDYIHNFLDHLNDLDVITKDNINFTTTFIECLSSKDRIFNSFFYHSDRVDSIMQGRRYFEKYLDYVIYKEEIKPIIFAAKSRGEEPDWRGINKIIMHKYGAEYADRNLLTAEVGWYRDKKEWKKYTRFLVQKVERFGIKDVQPNAWGFLYLNNSAWEVFLHSTSRSELKTAILWVDLAIPMADSNLSVAGLDTKANLLYKLGKRKGGLQVEVQVIRRAPDNEEFKNTFKNMTQGLPTWLEPDETKSLGK